MGCILDARQCAGCVSSSLHEDLRATKNKNKNKNKKQVRHSRQSVRDQSRSNQRTSDNDYRFGGFWRSLVFFWWVWVGFCGVRGLDYRAAARSCRGFNEFWRVCLVFLGFSWFRQSRPRSRRNSTADGPLARSLPRPSIVHSLGILMAAFGRLRRSPAVARSIGRSVDRADAIVYSSTR